MVPDAPSTSRRALLQSGLLVTVGLAGCLNGAGPGTPDDQPPTGTRNHSPDGDTPEKGDHPTGDAVSWTYHTGGSVRHPPTIHDGIVYAGGGTNDRATSTDDRVQPDTSENVYALTAADGSEQWRYEAPASVASSPVISDGVFVIVGWNAGAHGGTTLQLLRIDEGSKTWMTDARDRLLQLLAIAGGTVYLGTVDDQYGFQGETLIAVQASDGEVRWSVEAGDTTTAAVYDDTLYAVEGGRRTTAFDVDDWSERWHRNMRPGTNDPRRFGDVMYLESEAKNEAGNYPVVAVDAHDGRTRWEFSVPVDEPFVPTGAVASDESVFITEYDGWLFAVDPADGTEQWRYSTDDDTTDSPVVLDDVVYLATSSGTVHAVDAATGEQQWTRTLPGHARIAAGNRSGLVVRGGTDEGAQYLRAYAPDSSERWAFSHAGDVTRPAVDGTRAVIGTASGYVVALAEP
jgi:outer membrane protein assembly factor BamB